MGFLKNAKKLSLEGYKITDNITFAGYDGNILISQAGQGTPYASGKIMFQLKDKNGKVEKESEMRINFPDPYREDSAGNSIFLKSVSMFLLKFRNLTEALGLSVEEYDNYMNQTLIEATECESLSELKEYQWDYDIAIQLMEFINKGILSFYEGKEFKPIRLKLVANAEGEAALPFGDKFTESMDIPKEETTLIFSKYELEQMGA